jgi:hypothetical protein
LSRSSHVMNCGTDQGKKRRGEEPAKPWPV